MTVESINFNQNLKTYAINGDESNVVKINTADYGIFDRADKAKAILAELSNRANNATTDNAFTELSEIDKETSNLKLPDTRQSHCPQIVKSKVLKSPEKRHIKLLRIHTPKTEIHSS